MNKLEDYPFLTKEKEHSKFGLRGRVYTHLLMMAKTGSFKTKQEILEILKGKSRKDLLRIRNFGHASLNELVKWVKKTIEDENQL